MLNAVVNTVLTFRNKGFKNSILIDFLVIIVSLWVEQPTAVVTVSGFFLFLLLKPPLYFVIGQDV